jgi:5'-deoxy-5'-methylthioadenosine phosphorylase
VSVVAIIGGSGLQSLDAMSVDEKRCVNTPYGDAHLVFGRIGEQDAVFLTRHGEGHSIAPHQINYRANISALKSVGVQTIIAVNAVGSIRPEWQPGCIVIPDQLIDYTWGRESTFYDASEVDLNGSENSVAVQHIDFSEPYSSRVREAILEALAELGFDGSTRGVYGCTQGPRLETSAEIQRFKRDGSDLVGMTGMPEAALARELDLDYASLCLVVNPAAGITEGAMSLDAIMLILEKGMQKVQKLINVSVSNLHQQAG